MAVSVLLAVLELVPAALKWCPPSGATALRKKGKQQLQWRYVCQAARGRSPGTLSRRALTRVVREPKREELKFRSVLAFPKASRSGATKAVVPQADGRLAKGVWDGLPKCTERTSRRRGTTLSLSMATLTP